jgi:hypothetical protein
MTSIIAFAKDVSVCDRKEHVLHIVLLFVTYSKLEQD